MELRCAATTALGLAVCGLMVPPANAVPLGTAFTYQGQLKVSGQPATGLFDLQLCLYDSLAGPLSLACAPDFDDVPVDGGLFTIAPDFGGAAFSGEQRWLELRVRPFDSGGAYTVLSPRQLVRAAPEALRANTAPWSGLGGVPVGFADGVDDNSGGTVTSVGSGAGLSGGPITGAGTLGIAPAGVALSMIAADAVDGARVADGSIGIDDLGTDSVAADEIVDQSVGATEIGPNAVNASELADNAVDSAAIGDYFRGVSSSGVVLCEPLPGRQVMTTVADDANPIAAGRYSSISLNPGGLPFIAFAIEGGGPSDQLGFVVCDNAACTTSAAGGNGSFVSALWMSTASSFASLVSYYDDDADALMLAECDTSCESPVTLENSASDVGKYNSITIPADNRAVVSYWNATAGTLKLARCNGPLDCSAPTLVTVDDPVNLVGDWTSSAVAANGFAAISYHDITAGALKFAQCLNALCSSPGPTIVTLDDPATNQVGTHTSLAIGSDGLPVIAYYDSTALALKVAKCTIANCSTAPTITVVDDSANNVGQWSSIVVGSDNMPLISYYDATAGVLKLARCLNAACTSSTIQVLDDQVASVGEYSSMVIGVDGLPIISYFDAGTLSLKVLRCGTRSCQ